MRAKVIVNGELEFNLTRWNAYEFNTDTTLYIQTSDLTAVRDAFNSISSIAIVVNGLTMAQYVTFDSYSQISFLNKIYSEDFGAFVDTMSVTLQKTDLANQVQRLDDQINNVVDVDSLTLEELRNYKLKQISEACTKDICDGETIELPDGSRQHFQYDEHDQQNFQELFLVCIIAPDVKYLPYHSSGHGCVMFGRKDIITIVSTLLIRKTQLITYCNQLTQYARTLTEREDIMGLTYGMELPQEYQDRIAEIMASTIAEMEKFLAKIMPVTPDEEQEDETPAEEDPETPTTTE